MNRDRIAVLIALVGVTALAWIGLIRMSAFVNPSAPLEAMQIRPWEPLDFGLVLLMWILMMVGMMVPTAAPMTLTYAAVARKAARNRTPVPPTMVFVAGYVFLWALFSVLAASAQWGLDQVALLSPTMVTTSPTLGAALLIGAGTYQLTPFKRVCLNRCRSPAHRLSSGWKDGVGGAFRMGMEHGTFCVGCCWALMGLLFVGGVMNLLWVAFIAAVVFAEKLFPAGERLARAIGALMVAAGIYMLLPV